MRAKFVCESITRYATGTVSVSLKPVSSGDGNKEWSQWTPSGSLVMSITNPAVVDFIKPGKEYYLDFTEVGKDA
jgi:hypothetical protein